MSSFTSPMSGFRRILETGNTEEIERELSESLLPKIPKPFTNLQRKELHSQDFEESYEDAQQMYDSTFNASASTSYSNLDPNSMGSSFTAIPSSHSPLPASQENSMKAKASLEKDNLNQKCPEENCKAAFFRKDHLDRHIAILC